MLLDESQKCLTAKVIVLCFQPSVVHGTCKGVQHEKRKVKTYDAFQIVSPTCKGVTFNVENMEEGLCRTFAMPNPFSNFTWK